MTWPTRAAYWKNSLRLHPTNTDGLPARGSSSKSVMRIEIVRATQWIVGEAPPSPLSVVTTGDPMARPYIHSLFFRITCLELHCA